MDAGTDSEWLVTNGVGGFASSTVIDCPTRKYHGLLVTPLPGREGRFHILSAVEANPPEHAEFGTSTFYYPMTVHPQGYRHLESFSALPVPEWVYAKADLRIGKAMFMARGESSVYIVYTALGGEGDLQLDLKFLFTFRDANSTTKENPDISTETRHCECGFGIRPYASLPSASVEFSGAWKRSGDWYWDKNIEYPVECRRGLDYREDRFVPGETSIVLEKDRPFVVRVSVDNNEGRNPPVEKGRLKRTYRSHLNSRQEEAVRVKSDRELLEYMACNFILKNSRDQTSINAGFPWFGEWGRDTMIALPGLSFSTGKTELGIDILCDYSSMIKDGLLPNTLGESQGFTSYNSMDAGLLYCWAVRKLLDTGIAIAGRIEREILPAVESIVYAFLRGRVPRARLTPQGLLDTGDADTQLTWMDATAWGKPVTPRHGLAVDLNALWYDSLWTLKSLVALSGKKVPGEVGERLESIAEVFTDTFLVGDANGKSTTPVYLSDTCVGGMRDGKIRPNMLFASSAAPGLVSAEVRCGIVETARSKLLTPMGLRTLSPDDPDFAPVYRGNADERDSRYHQGTVWPWPLGIMIESALASAADLEKEAVFWDEYLRNLLANHLHRQGIGFVSEIFDGLDPVEGKGCFAQAWSTGEILRAYSLIEKTGVLKQK
ncbi:MAG: hypothetical protein GY866_04770 [Proteobacteria bacterium]|nr:hypothetical protein [Pseudomonadota bacterium]